MHPDYYKILGIPHDASDTDIRKAFRAKAKETHPDNNPTGNSENNFVLVNEAYDILIHHKTREIFDGPAPEHYPAYQHWLQVARERAVVHSRLPYSEFVRTKFYHSTRTSPYAYYMVMLLLGVLLIAFSLIILFVSTNEVVGVALFMTSLPVGIFLIVIGLGGISSVKKYKKERKKEIKKIQKAI